MNISGQVKKEDWIKHFPIGYLPREQQVIAINNILNAFVNDLKKYVIMQAPVGSGKSHIAVTVSNYMNLYYDDQSYLLTTQLILQDQYKNEFKQIANVSAKNNYKCIKNPDSNIGLIDYMHKILGFKRCEDCPYVDARNKFGSNKISLTNVKWFLCNLLFLDFTVMLNRKFMCIDEAHNLLNLICSFKTVSVDLNYMHKEYGLPFSEFPKNINIILWLASYYVAFLLNRLEFYNRKIEKFKGASDNVLKKAFSLITSMIYRIDYIDRQLMQLKRAFSSFTKNNWIIDRKFELNIITLTPLFAHEFSHDCLFRKAKHVLLMSGTILDSLIFAKSLGIAEDKYSYFELPNMFPINNRLIHYLDCGDMSQSKIHLSLLKAINAVVKILNEHKGQKGIIHTNSHKLAKTIADVIEDDRLLIVDDFNKNRDLLLEHHYKSNKDTVIISPSMTLGVDLKDDLSRFQIIVKMPFMYLGDKFVKSKMLRVKDWYNYCTAKALVQSYGRSIRSSEDKADTYILDSAFGWWSKKNNKLLPDYFKEAIRITKKK